MPRTCVNARWIESISCSGSLRTPEEPSTTSVRVRLQLASKQLPDAEKRARATFVVDTGDTIEATLSAVDRIIDQLQGRSATAFAAHWS